MTAKIDYRLITTTDELAAVCREVREAEFLAIDTEFMRDNTYWPKLCLLQFATRDQVFLADPLAEAADLSPFFEMLRSARFPKIFHAARQDIEIFHHLAGTIPEPLFDTQVAGMACGYGDAIGYEALVQKILRTGVDKSSRASDWSMRPLSARQLNYAAQDVYFLRDLYPVLHKQLEDLDRLHWLEEEVAELTNPMTYNLDPESAWKRLKLRSNARRNLGILVEVAAWREREARARNLPRARILKDDALYDVISHKYQTIEALASCRLIPRGFVKSDAAHGLIGAVKRGLERPRESLPRLEHPPQATNGTGAIVDILKIVLKMQCETFNVAQKLIANVSDLERIAIDDQADVRALKGWRRRVFGEAALKVKNGELSIRIENGRAVLVEDGTAGYQLTNTTSTSAT